MGSSLTAAPFLVKLARRDPPVVLVAPVLLIARAAALGTGLVAAGCGLRGRASPREAVLPGPARALKWLLDMTVALLGLLLAVPLLLVAAVLIKLDSRGPVFFVQTRLGQNGTAVSHV